MENPLISIIIPTYNRSNVLSRAINSVLKQTISDWELFVVDDCSTDDTVDIINNFKNKDKRIKIITLDKNSGGASAPRNIALKNIKGKYVAFLDSDDEWLPDKLEKQINLFLNSKENVGIVYTGAFFIDKNNKIRIKKAFKKGFVYNEELAYNPIGSPSRVMVKAACFKKCGLFDEGLLCAEDWDMWIRISKEYYIDFINLPLVNYFESSDSISVNFKKLIDGYKIIWEKHNIISQDKWIVASNYIRLGHRLCFYGNMKNGRDFILKSIKIEPYNIKGIFLFLVSLFGHGFYYKIVSFLMKNF